jgi:hypothetical protein
MKTIKNSRTSIRIFVSGFLASLFILAALTLSAEDYTKTYKEKYPVEKGAVLNIVNKFGNVHCQVWEESSVSITVTVKVDASSQEKADKVFDKISVQLSGSATRIDGTTTVGSINNSEFSIDYDIMMPKWINIDLDNSFGEIYTGTVDGTVKINLEYGSMDAEAFNGTGSDITLKFSEGEVETVKGGKVNVEYGGFEAGTTGNLEIVSRFSHVKIDGIDNLNLDSQYDEITIGQAGQVIAISRFSGMEYEGITGNFEFDVEYGDMTISRIGAGFGTGKIRNSFANADLKFDPKSAFTVDAEMEFGDMDYPKSNSSVSKQTEGYTTNLYKGRIGSASTASGQLTIRSKNANVSLSFAQ